MAISAERAKTAMILQYDEGKIEGKQMVSRKRYATLKNATDEGIQNAAMAIADLTTKNVLNVQAEKLDNITKS